MSERIINPLELIRGISDKSVSSRMTGSSVNSSAFRVGSMTNPFEQVDSFPISSRVSSDSNDRWFMMGISTWEGSSDIVSE